MTETAHTPLIVGNGGHAHGAEFEIRAADGTDRYVTGIPWAEANAPESGAMLSYGEAHAMAQRIVQAVNSHHRLVEALEPFAFVGEDGPKDTQAVWEMIYRDRVQDWFSYEDFERARDVLAALKEAGR